MNLIIDIDILAKGSVCRCLVVWKGDKGKRKVHRSAGMKGASQVNTTNLTLCFDLSSTLDLFAWICITSAVTESMPPSMRSSMMGYAPTEATSFAEEPRTPLRHTESRDPQADAETISIQGARRESRLSTLRVDTHVSGSLQSGSRRVSPSGSTDDSPASSTSAHSRQDSTASYTPLRSARGSLSLGVSKCSRPWSCSHH